MQPHLGVGRGGDAQAPEDEVLGLELPCVGGVVDDEDQPVTALDPL
jgi:hypothetical protein